MDHFEVCWSMEQRRVKWHEEAWLLVHKPFKGSERVGGARAHLLLVHEPYCQQQLAQQVPDHS